MADHAGDADNIESDLGELVVAGILVDPLIGDSMTDNVGGVEFELLGTFEDGGAEAADDGVVFEGEDGDVAGEEIADELGVYWFGESGVVVGDVVFGAEGFDRCVGIDGWSAETQDGGIGAVGVEIGVFIGEEAGFAELILWSVAKDIGDRISRVAN